ncbi:hypothetical protein DXG01_009568 [Tephrocybe rancida]|nr:hypothetical protein DXG01_009568 [Tephrocybe rancida]
MQCVYDANNSTGKNAGVPAPAGSASIEKLYQLAYDKLGVNHTGCASDKETNYEAELFGGEVGIVPCDNIGNLALDAYLWNAQASAKVIGQLLTADPKVILRDPPRLVKFQGGKRLFNYAVDLGKEHLEDL